MKTITFIFMLIMFQLTLNSQWQSTNIPQGGGVTDMVALNDGTLIVTTASFNWPNGQPGGIRRSTDGGNTWQNIMNIYNSRTLHLGTNGRLFASCWDYPQNEGMFFSTNNGLNWQQSFFGAANDNVFSIASKNGDSMVYVGTRNGVYRSFNNGAWIQLTTGMPANTLVRDLAILDNMIFAGTTKGLYKSTNHGNSWAAVNGIPTSDTVVKINISTHSTLHHGEVKSIDAGTSNGKVYTLLADQYETADLLYVALGFEVSGMFRVGNFAVLTLYPRGGMGTGRIIFTTDGGENWQFFNTSGMSSGVLISAMAMVLTSPNYLIYAGLFLNTNNGAQLYKYSSVIGINEISNNTPAGFELSQNYPNPFNPTTNIEFAIPKSSFVKLIVYDMLGREVETLVSKDLKAGTYKADWNASKYTSGVYFYKLITENFTETKKAILTK